MTGEGDEYSLSNIFCFVLSDFNVLQHPPHKAAFCIFTCIETVRYTAP